MTLLIAIAILSGVACRATVAPVATAPAAHLPAPTQAAAPSAPGDGALRSPFDVERRRAMVGVPLPAPRAAPATPPIRDVEGVSFYVDDQKSIADPDLKARNLAALAPLRDFVAAITGLADGWMVSRPADVRYARLAVDALAAWAAGGALLGTVNRQGAYEREWTLGSLALAYLKVRDAPGGDPAARAAIERWLCAIAAAVQPPYERTDRKSSANNHAYWTGLAVGAAGVACQDRRLFAWGLARARIGIGQVGADGLLPLELERGQLALHYHLFALAPLVMLAELAQANSVPLYDENGRALRRLADRVIAGLADPTSFEGQTGLTQQQVSTPPRRADLAWAEPYFARFHDGRLAAWIARARPLTDVRLGGDLTAAFGDPGGATGS